MRIDYTFNLLVVATSMLNGLGLSLASADDPFGTIQVKPPVLRAEGDQDEADTVVRSQQDQQKSKHLCWDYKRQTASGARILAALDEDTTLEFIETPLTDVVEFLQDLHDIPVKLDRRNLDDLGISTDEPITVNLKGISLRSALRLMLNDLDLEAVIESEVLLITTAERASAMLDVRVYETRSLKDFPPDALADAITATVAPDSWQEAGGPGAVRALPGCLVVRQTAQTHRQIVALLEQLKAHAENPLFTGPAGYEE